MKNYRDVGAFVQQVDGVLLQAALMRPANRELQFSAKVTFMQKLTPWFDAKLHSPVRDGWYDCKECNGRHYFKDGCWFRNKKSVRYGPMIIQKMHWRGLTMEGLADAARAAADRTGAAIDAAMEFVAASTERIAAMESAAMFDADLRQGLKEVKQGKVKTYKFGN